jgi:hypothetical protein
MTELAAERDSAGRLEECDPLFVPLFLASLEFHVTTHVILCLSLFPNGAHHQLQLHRASVVKIEGRQGVSQLLSPPPTNHRDVIPFVRCAVGASSNPQCNWPTFCFRHLYHQDWETHPASRRRPVSPATAHQRYTLLTLLSFKAHPSEVLASFMLLFDV